MHKYKIIYRKKADADINQAKNWYENQKEGLGDDFHNEVKELASKYLTKHPKIYQIAYQNKRFFSLNRFQHKVIYIINEIKNEVVILAVQHHKQHPQNWMN
jgi:plasmid stabilization system protein ParE